MLIEQIILVFIGLSGGLLVAAGFFAFTVMVGVVGRIVARTKTIRNIWIYEDSIVLGAVFGIWESVFHPQIPGGILLLALFGIFSGIFAGALAIALAEAVNAIPVFVRRIRLKIGVAYIVTAFALGKCFGSVLELVLKS